LNNKNNNNGSEKMSENNEMKTTPKTMNEMEIEALDYKLSRLKPGHSTCIRPGEWAFLSPDGSLHRLVNEGYYAPWKRDMWTSSYWMNDGWGLGLIAASKGRLINRISNHIYPLWMKGFGKGGEATEQQEVWA